MKKKPGVSDNKTYKDMYHFSGNYYNDSTSEDNPSVHYDGNINSTIKENPYRSNVEVEKDEVILQPDLSALFKARGKTHKQGGIDVLLKPDSFVFSDDKSLAFSEDEQDLFEFKKGGKFKADKNTPAEVLKRNIDVKHYNQMIANISDIKKDDLAKKSSAMMIEKYINTLGNIAFLQESKKDFPTGVPPFSEGRAPVYESGVKNDIMSQKQYAKYGGTIMARGGFTDPCPCGKDSSGNCLPCEDKVYDGLLPSARRVAKAPTDYQFLYKDPTGSQLYGKFGNVPPKSGGKMMSDAAWKAFINSPQGKASRSKRMGVDTEDYVRIDPELKLASTPDNIPHEWDEGPLSQSNPYTNPVPGDITSEAMKGVDINWQFTPWQKVSQGYNLAKYASAKRYMPYRSHFNPSYVDPSLINPEQAVGDMKGAFNKNIDSLNTLNPILRNAQASASYGQMLNQIPGLRSQYDNQNAQITNQFRQGNNQIRNNATLQNMQNDQQYYQQSVVGQQNFDNMKNFLGDQYMNNLMGDVQDNQSLAYNLATLKNPAYGFDFKSGNYYRNPKNILDVDNASNTQENLLDLAKNLRSQGFGEKLIGDIIKSKAFQTWNPSQKKGGRITNPYKNNMKY